jgi:hypothetical protein
MDFDSVDLTSKDVIANAEKLAVKMMNDTVGAEPLTAYIASLLVHKYLKGLMLDKFNAKTDPVINIILHALDKVTDQMIVDFFKPEVTKE